MIESPEWIKDLATNNPGRILIVVEGEDDVAMLKALLQVVSPRWKDRFMVEPVNGKKRVYQACRNALGQHWRGLVDCDEWGPTKVDEESTRTPNVKILDRFTAENYWINPDELFRLIPVHHWSKYPQAQAQIRTDIESALPDWIAHGVMWRVMLLRQSGFCDLRFPNELMESPVTDEMKIRDILTRWHDHLNPDSILGEYHRELEAAQNLAPFEQYSKVVHGKRFFRQVVMLALNRAFQIPSKTHEEWAKDLNATTERLNIDQIPEDLLNTVNALLA